ncbi:hypothetical protein NWP22_16220 [Anabaenopsis tanganyikae CS-531]|uniref:Uncharacterized protein n=2 Tax=Anabaenopsis TaxID=110103 RepID=A0ABT5AYC4_9CYAN|nr:MULTISPECIES: hypothetical protein [Anabaenopsis]MDB9541416.1 hypothetical protein [Anabaenopsis arnoldii]MDH6090395.1 hypothetical protein [Anabaenopsis arnoldii]MDH6107388.1 hypothetical protein [Anabaenopsis tanganyikae CS-531]
MTIVENEVKTYSGKDMKSLAKVAFMLLFSSMAVTAFNPISQVLAQEGETSPQQPGLSQESDQPESSTSTPEATVNQQLDIKVEAENEIETESAPPAHMMNTPDGGGESGSE